MLYIRALADISYDDIPLVGGKAAALGEMLNAGLPVPPGFVGMPEAYKQLTTNRHRFMETLFDAFDRLNAIRNDVPTAFYQYLFMHAKKTK